MSGQEVYWQQFDEAFFKDGYNLCDRHLSMGFNKDSIMSAQKQLYKVVDELIDSFLKRTAAEQQPTECRKGCAYCCHQTVLASGHELLYLAAYLKKKFPGNALKTIVDRAATKAEVSSKLKMSKLLRYKQACPLLHSKGNFCMAYQARPMACRIYLSRNVQSCIDDLNSPNDDKIYPQLFDMPLRAGRMLNEGFQARLRKGRMDDLQVFESTIETGLLGSFVPDAFENWIKGRKVFQRLPK